jgi:hypothetical protein
MARFAGDREDAVGNGLCVGGLAGCGLGLGGRCCLLY